MIAAALPFALSKYHVFELTMVMIYAIAVLGLNILTGYNGQISLGHGGFFAVGAYTAAILMHRYGVPYWATLPPAALIGFALGVLFGLPALRFEGPYLALVTLAMALATPQLLKYFDTWTGGQQGINLVKPMPPAGLGLDRDRWLYFVVLVVLLVAIRIAANILHGRTGRAFVAIRDHPIAAAAMGIDTATLQDARFRHLDVVHGRRRERCRPSSSVMSRLRVTVCFSRSRFWSAPRSAASPPSAARLSVDSLSSSCRISPTTFPTPRRGRSTGWRCCCSCTPCRAVSSARLSR